MKKTFNINIGNKVFNIDDDAYDLLNKYLDSIKKYFDNIDSEEDISVDIENRISEKFSKIKLVDESLTINDIKNIINEMGSLDDFKEIYEEYSIDKDEDHNKNDNHKTENKRIFRNENDKVIAGVASGIANYFKIDPIITRLIFLASLLTGFGLIIYLICWIGIPSKKIDIYQSPKRLYRDSDNKIIGGVAFGISNYFKVDPALVRILFVISLFIGGFGLITYFLLWISIPEAKTVEEKMRAKGYEITLDNIEKYIKGAFKQKQGEENILLKIILFPFRIVGPIIFAIFSIIFPIIRLFISFILFIFSVVFIVLAVIFTLGIFNITGFQNFTIGSINGFYIKGADLSTIIGELPAYLSVSILLFFIFTLLILILAISKILLNTKSINPSNFLGLIFIVIALFIFNSFVLSDKIEDWKESGQIDEWVEDGVIKIEKWRNYRY